MSLNIICPSCGNHKRLRTSLWVKSTFRIEDDGMIRMLHLNPLESLEEKITDSRIQCKRCGTRARVVLDEFQTSNEEKIQKKTLEGLCV